ncbi:MAG: hypothetical protein K9L66_03980 [Spirochaetaceae bacterium]|nr:hypothetical protein [Spirochaetaceae bacterium]MCF7948196.1 hypothetical protein [Spirochaetia bacterium]MCF7950812.1 hypothetical protein [Spirochaetaceae bacterium]
MKYALTLLCGGITLSGIAVQLQLNIQVLLAGICVSALAVTWSYLILAKQQYERLSSETDLNSVIKGSSTRPAA